MITTVVNLFGGPGSGKSTLRAGLFAELKQRGVLCEEATEYAKDLCWENNPRIGHQLSVFAEQAWRIDRLMGKVRFVITDSPILLSLAYIEGMSDYDMALRTLVAAKHREMRNMNLFVRRVKPYEPAGRYQDEAGAQALDRKVLDVLRYARVNYATVDGDERAPAYLADMLCDPRAN